MAAPILLCYIDVSTLYYLYLTAVVREIIVCESIIVNYYWCYLKVAYKKIRLNSMQGNQPNLLPLFLM